jgi:hypothetical protein
MPTPRYSPRLSDDPTIRELQLAVRALQPVDSATVKFSVSDSGLSARAEIMPPPDRSVIFGFRSRLVRQTDGTYKIAIWRGNRRIIGAASEEMAPSGGEDEWLIAITAGQTAYFGFTYSTLSTPGDWMADDPVCGTDPADTATKFYFRIATMDTNEDGMPYLLQRHLGDAVVEDRLVYEECPA